MSEHGPSTSSPDTKKFDFEKRDEVVLPFLHPDAVAAFRRKQNELATEELKDVLPGDDDGESQAWGRLHAQFDPLMNDFLKDFKIEPDDPNIPKYKTFLESFGVDKLDEFEWNVGKTHYEDTGTVDASGKRIQRAVSGRERAERQYNKFIDSIYDKNDEITAAKGADPADPDKDKDKDKAAEELKEKIEKLSEALELLQDAKHKAFAARMAVSFFARKKKKELGETYEEAEAAYLEGVKALELLKAQEFEGESQEETNNRIAKNITERLHEDRDLQMEAMLNEGGLKAELLKRYQELSPVKKVAIGIAVGAFLAAGGAAMAAGLAGGIAATIASGIIVGAKTGRTYMVGRSRLYQGRKDDFEFSFDNPQALTTEQAASLATGHLKWESHQDIEDADKKKRNAVLFAMGTAATGGIVGAGVIDASEAGNWLTGWLGGADHVAAVPNMNPPLDADHAWVVDKQIPKGMEFTPGSQVLEEGDGGHHVLMRMNIPQEHWAQLWQNVGPELQNVNMPNGRPFSYKMPNGEWGIRMTPDQKVPKEALEAIANKHEALFGVKPPSVIEQVAPVSQVSETIPVNVENPVLSHQEAVDLKGVLAAPRVGISALESHPALFESLRNVAPNLELHRYMTEALGVPNAVWNESVLPYINTQLDEDNEFFKQAFTRGDDNIIRFNGGKLTADVVAELLNTVPSNIRQNFVLAG